jgi:hypothetical protein
MIWELHSHKKIELSGWNDSSIGVIGNGTHLH